MRTAYHGAAAHDLDSCKAQHALVDAVQARDLAILVGEQSLPVERGRLGGPAEGGGDLEFLAEMRRVAEQLFRDAADVDAGAAEQARLGDRDARPIAGADAAGADAAGAASYCEEVVVEAQGAT
jgi:hypothetical protein